jgi:hypothetical protein
MLVSEARSIVVVVLDAVLEESQVSESTQNHDHAELLLARPALP